MLPRLLLRFLFTFLGAVVSALPITSIKMAMAIRTMANTFRYKTMILEQTVCENISKSRPQDNLWIEKVLFLD